MRHNSAALFCIILLGFSSLGQAPGGVTNNLTSWFTPEAGFMTVTGVDVSDWDAQAGGIDVTEAATFRQPDYITGDPECNFGNYVQFDGTDDALNNPATGDILGTAGYIFLASGHINGINHITFDGPNANYQVKGLRVGYQATNGDQWQILFNTMPAPASPLGRPVITAMKGGPTAYCRRNGNLSTTQTNPWGAQVFNNLALGQRGNYSEFCNFRMSEFFTYDGPLTVGEINRIESYLAVKYGITLGINGTSLNYTSSLGTTVWDIAANAGYNWDIAGIGRDDNSLLAQLKSHSVNGPVGGYNDIVTMAHGNNFAAPTAIGANESFLIWGHDNMSLDCQNTDVAMTVNGDNVTERMAREWKSQETGTIGLTTLEFDMTNSSLGSWGFSNYKLLVDADGDFTNGATSISPSLVDIANNKLYFEHDFAAATGFYFTIGVAHATVSITGAATICAGDTTDLMLSIVGASGPIDVTYDDGSGPITVTGAVDGQLLPVNPGATTTYSISAVMSTTCYTMPASSATVTVEPAPTVTATATTIMICTGDPVTLTGSGNATGYTWDNGVTDGVSFTPAATADYIVTGVSANGCVSADTITVTVGNSIIVTANASDTALCPGDSVILYGTGANTYAWDNGVADSVAFAINTTTTFNVNGTSSSGCTGSDQITITVFPSPSVQANASSSQICLGDMVTLTGSGAVTYTWDQGVTDATPFSPTDTAQYTVTGVDANGCEDTDSIIVVVNPLPTVIANTSNDTICEGDQVTLTGAGADTYLWDNSAVDGTPFSPSTTELYTVTGTDTNGCVGTDAITVEVIPTVVVDAGADQSICDGQSISLTANNPGGVSISWNNGVTDGASFTPAVGVNEYIVTGTNWQCSQTDTVVITVNPNPTFMLSSSAPTTCSGNDGSITLSGLQPNTDYNVTYTDSSASQGPTLMTTNGSGEIVLGNLVEGDYWNFMVELNGCSGTLTDTLSLITPNNAGAEFTTADTLSICNGDSALLTIELQGTAPWTLDIEYNGLPLPQVTGLNNSTYSAWTSDTGVYVITSVVDSLGCQGAVTNGMVVVEEIVPPAAPIVSGAGTYCSDANIPHLIAANTGGAIHWYSDSNLTVLYQNNDTIFSQAFEQPGEYNFWVAESYFGCQGDSTPVTMTILDAGYLIVEDTVHICLGDTATISPYSSAPVLWDGPAGVLEGDISITPELDTVLLGWMDTECGMTNHAVWVFVHAIPVVDAGPDQAIYLHETTQLLGQANTSVVWSPSITLSCDTCLMPTSTPLETTQYIITATSEWGCTLTDTVVVEIIGEWELFVPNIFSPNGDGWNDVVDVQGPPLDEYKLAIFNRWGEKVFETNDITQQWDGTWRGKPADQGVYPYILKARVESTQIVIERGGNITLVK